VCTCARAKLVVYNLKITPLISHVFRDKTRRELNLYNGLKNIRAWLLCTENASRDGLTNVVLKKRMRYARSAQCRCAFRFIPSDYARHAGLITTLISLCYSASVISRDAIRMRFSLRNLSWSFLREKRKSRAVMPFDETTSRSIVSKQTLISTLYADTWHGHLNRGFALCAKRATRAHESIPRGTRTHASAYLLAAILRHAAFSHVVSSDACDSQISDIQSAKGGKWPPTRFIKMGGIGAPIWAYVSPFLALLSLISLH